MKKITILSGKGGVGKSSITSSLAVLLSERLNNSNKLLCIDCDVDASNLSLVLGSKDYHYLEDISTNKKAFFDLNKCNSCKLCVDNCYFKAIDWVNYKNLNQEMSSPVAFLKTETNKPILKDFSCEGCGLCELICPQNAIELKPIINAKLGYSKTPYGFNVFFAQLNPGESGSGKLVTQLKDIALEHEVYDSIYNSTYDSQHKSNAYDYVLIDSAAGIGCPVIASVTGSDYVILVTEPTPSGFSDLKKAFEIVKHFNIHAGIIVNKFDLNLDKTNEILKFAKENNIISLGNIPFDKGFAKALVNKKPIVIYNEIYKELFSNILNKLLNELK